MEQVAGELGIGLVSYSMTHHTRQSALGLPYIVEKTYGNTSVQVSEYTMSEIIAAVYDYMEETGLDRGILFLDEINCVSETLYPSMLQFLQFKTFGRHRVPDGWIVVCAGNPPEYNKSVHEFDVVTLDRLRKIEAEPDLDAWLSYAQATGVHPAIISYLGIRQNHFYSIESTPSGKAFVTARGWDDLSKVIRLFEAQGAPVDRALVEQFLQNDEIAERFAQYYVLFNKYRSDYQVLSILDGNASDDIRARAREARFDERLALIRLMIDALSSQFDGVLEAERLMCVVRDTLRAVKSELLSGASALDVLGREADHLTEEAARNVSLDLASDADVKHQRLAASQLRNYASACEQERTLEGAPAFEVVSARYASDTQALRERVSAASAMLDAAFSFVESTFADDREMAAFVAELAAHRNTSQFISHFGNDAYYAHSCNATTATAQESLLERIGALDLQAAAQEQEAIEEAARLAAEKAARCGSCSCSSSC